MRKPHTSCSRGFTLLEMMIALSIVVVLVTFALPDVIRATRTVPIVQTAEEVMDRFSFARVSAANGFRAYGVQVLEVGRGVVSVHRSETPSCVGIDWSATGRVGRVVDLETRWQDGTAAGDIHILGVEPGSVNRVCYTPDGRLVNGDTSQPLIQTGASGLRDGEYAVEIQRFVDDASDVFGPKHFLVFPSAGRARMLFGSSLAEAEGWGGT